MLLEKIINIVKNWRRVRSLGIIASTSIIRDSWVVGNVSLGNYTEIIDDVRLVGNIEIGDYTSINGPNTQLFARVNKIVIGKYCSIARGCTIQEYNHNVRKMSTYMINSKLFNKKVSLDIYSKGSVTIGNDVWLGAQSVILSGVNIGNGCIIAANSVVTKDVPPYAIVAGVPAKIISYRFSPEIIEKLLELQWWNRSLDWLIKNNYAFQDKLILKTVESLINE